MDNRILNSVWFVLLFMMFRTNFGPSQLTLFSPYVIVFSFTISLWSVFKHFHAVSTRSRLVYLLMAAMTIHLFVSRYFNSFPFGTSIMINMILQLTLINFFMFVIRDDLWGKMKLINNVLLSYVIINLVTEILYPNGVFNSYTDRDSVWFLGAKNMIIRTLIPAFIVNLILSNHYKGQLSMSNYLFYVLCIVTVILSGISSTSIFVLTILGLCFFDIGIIRKITNLSIFGYLCIFFLISIFVIVFSFQDYFAVFFSVAFDKDASLSGRVLIWEHTLVKMMESPYIGFGYHTADEWKEVLGFSFSKNTFASHPHNLFLYMFVQGGIIYFLLYILLFYIISDSIRQYRKEKVFYLLTLMYVAFFIDGITESLTNAPLMFPLLALYMTIVDKKERGYHPYHKNLVFSKT